MQRGESLGWQVAWDLHPCLQLLLHAVPPEAGRARVREGSLVTEEETETWREESPPESQL